MMWTPWKRKPKADPVGDAERTTDELKQQLRDMRARLQRDMSERLLQETVENARKVPSDDR